MAHATTAGLTLLLINVVRGIEFPNNIIGTPAIYCGESEMELTVETSDGNPSHMFVLGRHDDPDCVTRNTNKITIAHEACGLSRERNLSPAGIQYRMCVSVQLHPQFVTKVDRTYCAKCFYTEGVNELTNQLEVSPQATSEIPVSFDAPICTYSIRSGSPTGPEVRYATVGEEVYHVWHCPSDLNGMLVQNCYVEDGQGNRILIIDQNGFGLGVLPDICGVDRYVMQTPNYTRDLTMAFQESHVFKFADKTITRFTCQIKICIKTNDGCRGVTPPENCAASGAGIPAQTGGGSQTSSGGQREPDGPPYRRRSKRSIFDSEFASMTVWANKTLAPRTEGEGEDDVGEGEQHDTYELDVSDELIVLDDPKDQLNAYLREELGLINDLTTIERGADGRTSSDQICVARHGAAMMLVISSCFALFGVILVIYLLKLSRRPKDECD